MLVETLCGCQPHYSSMTDAEVEAILGIAVNAGFFFFPPLYVLVTFETFSCAQRPMVHSFTMHWPSPDCDLLANTMSETASIKSAICLQHRTPHATHNAQTGDKTYRLMLL